MTGMPVRMEVPKSPRRTPPSQFRYCTGSGIVQVVAGRMAASVSGVAGRVPEQGLLDRARGEVEQAEHPDGQHGPRR